MGTELGNFWKQFQHGWQTVFQSNTSTDPTSEDEDFTVTVPTTITSALEFFISWRQVFIFLLVGFCIGCTCARACTRRRRPERVRANHDIWRNNGPNGIRFIGRIRNQRRTYPNKDNMLGTEQYVPAVVVDPRSSPHPYNHQMTTPSAPPGPPPGYGQFGH